MKMTGLLTTHFPKIKTLRAVLLLAVALSAGSLSAQGRTLWQDRGVQICGNTSDETPIAATSDSDGGAIVLWPDCRRGGYYHDIYAQRVGPDGVALWTAGGIPVRESVGAIWDLQVVDDGKHGAIAVWCDMGGVPWAAQLAAQRVSAEGVPLWGHRGRTIRGVNDDYQYFSALAPEKGGGVTIVCAVISYEGYDDTLFACRLDSGGSTTWQTVIRADTGGFRGHNT